MGRRELLLIVIFLAAAILVHRLTTQPSEGPGFSLTRLINSIRGEHASAPVKGSVRMPVPPNVRRITLRNSGGRVTIVGENRADIAIDFDGEVFGEDQAIARDRASKLKISTVVLGDTLQVETNRQKLGGQRRPRLNFQMRVPTDADIRVESNKLEVADVRRLEINTSDDAVIKNIAGEVKGNHRGGKLEIARAGTVQMQKSGSDLHLTDVSGETRLDLTNVSARIASVSGRLRIDGRRCRIEVDAGRGPIEIANSGEFVRVRGVRESLRVENLRGLVSIVLAAPAPVFATTSNDDLDLTVPPSIGVTVDAMTEKGTIRGPLVPPTSRESNESGQSFTKPLNGGGPTVTLRNRNGDIVIK